MTQFSVEATALPTVLADSFNIGTRISHVAEVSRDDRIHHTLALSQSEL